MSLFDQLNNDYKEAFKARDAIRKEILNYLLAQVKYKKIELQKELTDDDIFPVIKKEIKARQESIVYLQKSGNIQEEELENTKISILSSYLPKMLSREELLDIVKKVILENDVQDLNKQRGTIIGAVMKDYKASVDGGLLNEVINSLK